MPNLETHIWHHTISWNVLLPIIVLPMLMFTILLMLPFIEAWITGDKRDHHLLQRPRNAPTRTATMVALMTFIGLLWAAGGNDIMAVKFHLNLNYITYFVRVMVFAGPVIAFLITRRWCISLQRADQDRLLHGYESGVIMRSPEGAYAEKHLPISNSESYALLSRVQDEPRPLPTPADETGVPAPLVLMRRVQARLSQFWLSGNISTPTPAELEAARHHADHELAAHESAGHDDGTVQHDRHGIESGGVGDH
jgi:quinol---cytochrome-c reductase cytochrome b subunit